MIQYPYWFHFYQLKKPACGKHKCYTTGGLLFLFILLLLLPAPHNAHSQRIGAGVDGDGAADLQQADLALAGGVLGAEGGTGLHPKASALFLVVAVAHGNAVIVGGRAPLGQVRHQLFQRFLEALLAAAGHAGGEDLPILEEDHRLDAQNVGRAAGHLADTAALDEVIEVADREEDLVGGALSAQPIHGFVQ